MKTNKQIACKGDKGFTLVELAIVMIVIGLLLGGVLKGQELISNAQVAATVTAVKGLDAAATTFRDTYSAIPGDMTNATVVGAVPGRLPNCLAANNCNNGNGNSIVGVDNAYGVAQTLALENYGFFVHLNRAGLINAGSGSGNITAWGQDYPSSPAGGGIVVGYDSDGTLTNDSAATNASAGHYALIRGGLPNVASGAATFAFGASVASRIDAKMDDGAPNTGSVRAAGAAPAANTGCADVAGDAAIYNSQANPIACMLYIRIQN